MRQIVLDTETTGLDPAEGHRIIEIGCIEVLNRRRTDNGYHQYINPGREIDSAAIEIHGITNEFLADKPRFADIAPDFLAFIKGAELIIHNAAFDVGFINHELTRMVADQAENGTPPPELMKVDYLCKIVDSLALARSLHPGQKNDLDSLCKRYSVDNTHRTLHGARLDAEILADVYLAMTGGQTGLFEESRVAATAAAAISETRRIGTDRPPLVIVAPSADELAAHHAWLDEIDRGSGGRCLWKKLAAAG